MYNTILVPVDLNEQSFSDRAVEAARNILCEGGTLHLLKVVPGYQMPLVASFFPKGSFAVYVSEAGKNIQKFADQHLKDSGFNVEVHVKEGKAAEEIIELCAEVKAEAIVMASHKRNKLDATMIGSIAIKVVNHSSVPVMIVKPR